MAITVAQEPSQYHPAYNPIIYVCTSTNTAQENFQIEARIYDKTGTTDTLIATVRNPVNPEGSVVFDFTYILRNYVTHDFSVGDTLGQENNNSIFRYNVKFQEVYGDPPTLTGSIVTVGTAPTDESDTDTQPRIFNAAIPIPSFKDYNQGLYISFSNTQQDNHWFHRFSADTGVDCQMTDNFAIYGIAHMKSIGGSVSQMVQTVDIKSYTSAGSLIQTVNIDTAVTASVYTTFTGHAFRIPCGPYNLNAVPSGSINSGAQPIVPTNAAYYTVTVKGAEGDFYPFRVNVVDLCDRYNGIYRLHWMNRYGGFDAFNFELASSKVNNIQRVNYKTPLGTPTSNSWSFNKYDRTNIQMMNKSQERYTVISNWLSDAEAEALEDLFTSPVVYWEVNSTTYYSVNVIDAGYETKYSAKDKTFNLVLQFEPVFDYVTQTY